MNQWTQVGDQTKRIRSVLQAVLPPSVKVKPARDDPQADFVINGVPIQVKWAGRGWPRDVKPFLGRRGRRPDLVVGHHMSPGARQALAQAGVGWLDETGAAEFAIGSVVVSRTGQPPNTVGRQAGWTPSVLAVAEALLCDVKPTVSAVEVATGLSSGSCTKALRFLSDQGLLGAKAPRGRASARRILDPDKLLEEYAVAASSVPTRIALQVGVTWQDVVQGLAKTGRMWDKHDVPWAATGAAASLVLAPFLTGVRTAEVYVEARTVAELREAADVAGLRPMSGGRVTLAPFPTVSAQRLASQVDDIRVAPWPRVFADLRTTGVRGEETAEHLREVVIGEATRAG
jgi:hypothetical protein